MIPEPCALGLSGAADRPLGDRPATAPAGPDGWGAEDTRVGDPRRTMSAGLAEAIRAGVQ